MASLVAQNRGYSWGIWHPLRATALLKPLVEGRGDDDVPPRNEKIALSAFPAGERREGYAQPQRSASSAGSRTSWA